MVQFGWTCNDFYVTGHRRPCDVQSHVNHAVGETMIYLSAICRALDNIDDDAWLRDAYCSLFGIIEEGRLIAVQSKDRVKCLVTLTETSHQIPSKPSSGAFSDDFKVSIYIVHIP